MVLAENIASMEIYHPQVGILDLPHSIFATRTGNDAMKWLLLNCTLLLLSWSPAAGQEQPAVCAHLTGQQSCIQDGTFHSQSLGRDIRYRVILPRKYEDRGRFPVLYLLHGLYGDYLNWDTRTGLESYARNLPFLIVMPDAGNSWYTNSATVPADRFEDFIAKDLIGEIDARYHTIRDRHKRSIAGVSMGGYGAIKLALKYPELFVFAGSLSGAMNAAQNLDAERLDFRAKLQEVFGDSQSRVRSENDVFRILKLPDSAGYPYFYLACGTSDSFLPVNRAFVDKLSSLNVPYEYHETPGGHTWEYWDKAVQPLLRAVKSAMESPEAQEE
jgi:S-formylglutathione hydrolase FrmB